MTAHQTAPPAPAKSASQPSRIGATFARLKQEGRVALLPYLTVGFPDVETTLAAVPALVRGGADEIGRAHV